VSDHRAAVAAQSLLLRRAIEGTIRAEPALNARAAALSEAYRSGVEPDEGASHRHLQHPASAEAYAAARMPATFAAVARALGAAADRLPGFQPASLLDAGAGTGAASWAATAVWTSLVELTLVDREAAAIALGRRLATTAAAPGRVAGARWIVGDVDAELSPQSDLVVAAYLLGELPASEMDRAVARLWAATTGVLVLVEPGSRAGFERIRRARTALIEAGGTVAAPCPGNERCPIDGPAWCHFLARLDRSPLQRRAKTAQRSWEDEPFSYVALARPAVLAAPQPRVVLGRPRQRPGMVELRVCLDGRIETRTLSRRDGPAWRTARDLAWGDPVPPDVLGTGR